MDETDIGEMTIILNIGFLLNFRLIIFFISDLVSILAP